MLEIDHQIWYRAVTVSTTKLFALRHDEDAITSPALRVLGVFPLRINLFVVVSYERLDLWIDLAVRRILRNIGILVGFISHLQDERF